MSQTITYRGPPVLVGALAHLRREEGVEFERPGDDRRVFAETVEVVLVVRAGDPVLEGTVVDGRVDTAVAKFKKRFGDLSASVEVEDTRELS
jgi:hypothetical protein